MRNLVIVLVLACLLTLPCWAAEKQKVHVAPSHWWPEVEKVDRTLQGGNWKSGLKKARKLTQEILSRSWHGPDLKKILSKMALYHAVAEANLGKKDEAVWHWHIALNLDFRLWKEDLSPYGDAAKLLLEYPLRSRGKGPAGFIQPQRRHGQTLEPPTWPKPPATPPIVNNTGAALEHRGDFRVEVIVDQQGRPKFPVVLSPQIHPVITYATLEHLPKREATAALVDGEPVEFMITVNVQYQVIRW